MSDPIDYLLPVEHRSLHEGICDRIRKLIVHLGLEPGEKIDEKLLCERLGVSHKTVDNHRTNLMKKLDVHSVAELLSYALREGYLDGASQL